MNQYLDTETDRIIPVLWDNMRTKHVFACEPPPILYHYTSYDGANGIITSKSLWLTHIRYLNDTSELHSAIELFHMAAEMKMARIHDQGKREFLKTANEKIGSFKQYLRQNAAHLKGLPS